MQKAYTRIYWSNIPATTTPLGESKLLPMDASINEIDDRVVTYDTTKANQSDLLQSLKSVDYDTTTGIFIFTWWNGTTKSVDLNIEKIPVSFSMSPQGVITMTTADGTTFTADVSTLIKTYTFTDSSEIDFTVTTDASGNKTVTAGIVNGSITGSKLEPNYLANAQAAQAGAELAEDNAEDSATLAQSWAVGGTGTRTGEDTNNAEYWSEQARTLAHGTAENTSYDDTETGLGDNVQVAIDALNDALTQTNETIDITTTTLTGNPLNFSTESAQNASECVLTMDPVQDLHGYSKPWPAGGGKNLLPLTLANLKSLNTSGTWSDNVYSYNGIDTAVNIDSDENIISITVNGKPNSGNFLLTLTSDIKNFLSVGTSIIINGCPSGGSASSYYSQCNNIGYDYGSGLSGSVISATCPLYLVLAESYTATDITFYPMVRLSTETDATFAPYSNVCSISGRNSAEMVRCGKNLTSVTSGANQNLCYIESGESYTIAWDEDSTVNYNVFIDGVSYTYASSVQRHDGWVTITAPVSGTIKINNFSSANQRNYRVYVGIYTSKPDYEPYTAETKSYTLPSTVYGGTLDVNTGVLTVDWSVVAYDGSSDEAWYLRTTGDTPFFGIYEASAAGYLASGKLLLCDTLESNVIAESNDNIGIYNVPENIRVRYSSDTTLTVSDLRTWLADNPLRVVYPLATPATYQLTPAQVSLLLGTNNLYTDADSIEVTFSDGTYATLTDIQASEVSINKMLDIIKCGQTTAGTYSLQATVDADGNVTYSWV